MKVFKKKNEFRLEVNFIRTCPYQFSKAIALCKQNNPRTKYLLLCISKYTLVFISACGQVRSFQQFLCEMAAKECAVLTPFSPGSFDYYPGSPVPDPVSSVKTGSATYQTGFVKQQNFRFAPAPDGPLPSIPSGDESESEPEDFGLRALRGRTGNGSLGPRVLNQNRKQPEVKRSWKDFRFITLAATAMCSVGGIIFAVHIHKVSSARLLYSSFQLIT